MKICLQCWKEYEKKYHCSKKGLEKSKFCSRECQCNYKKWKHASVETRKKMSEKRKWENNVMFGKHHSDEAKLKISLANKWRIASEETRKKISDWGKWRIPYNKGKHHTEETKLKMSDMRRLEKNSNWQWGKSFETYWVDWTKTLRISIRERDHYRCKLCGEPQWDILHSVHHIDYNKKNCDPNNLITLCQPCHMKTNYNRDSWTQYFNSPYSTLGQ